MSIVATSSVLATGVPQSEQKRTPIDNSVRQIEHLAMVSRQFYRGRWRTIPFFSPLAEM